MDLKLLQKLCLASAVSGNEHTVKDIIIKEIENCKIEYYIDNIGNLIVFKKGKNRPNTRLMVAAHMDEVGLIVTHISDNGYLGFDIVGGIDPRVLLGINVFIGENNIPGVISTKPIHLSKKSDLSKNIDVDSLFIDIGAKNKEDALKYINIGDCVTFSSLFDIDQDRIISKSLDDRSGCFILINMIKKDLEYDTYFVFTTQEEIGLRGATTAAYSVDPQAALIVETTTANDLINVNDSHQICKLGKGSVVSFMDKRTIYDKEYYRLALSTAKENGINVQPKESVTGGNDAGAINLSRGGVRTIALSTPCRYLHSPFGIININDLKATYQLANLLSHKISSLNFSK